MLHHIEINVANLAISRAFYDKLFADLGYELDQEWEEGFSYRYRDTYLVFVQTEEDYREPSYHRKRTGLNHLAFVLLTKEKVDSLHERLRSEGVTLLYEENYPHAGGPDHYAVFFEDPDRLKIEVVWEVRT
ncbi:VOC family protein [Streptococcus respiraculi]|uniref:VOC family protein n=1 Tax=Streptococcus respiraculi TaxID=2021971 RepID=UPI000E752E1A|nr:VOC family protein [Streptococcus respiraculi]